MKRIGGALWLVLAVAPGRAAPPPGLHAQPASAFGPGQMGINLQAVLEQHRYPSFDLGLAQGLGGGLELQLQGLFRHMRYTDSILGNLHQYDFDEHQLALKWSLLGGPSSRAGVAPMIGWSRFTETVREGASARSSLRRTYRWGSLISSAAGPGGSRLIVTARTLQEVESDGLV
ncbi:MAG: hypothetical protein AAB368_13520, partial [bacterium]